MPLKQPVRSQRFLFDVNANHGESSMHVQAEKARSANDLGKSDDRIVPLKRENQSRGSKPGNAGAGKAVRPSRETDRTSTALRDGNSVITRLDRITHRAETHAEERFNNLFSLLTYELLWHAFRKLKRDKAPGVDGETVDQYELTLRDCNGSAERLVSVCLVKLLNGVDWIGTSDPGWSISYRGDPGIQAGRFCA